MDLSDRKIIIVLLSIIVVALGIIIFTGNDTSSTDESKNNQFWTDRKTFHIHSPKRTYIYAQKTKAERFPFDPNTADSTQLLRLGLQPWQVKNIYRYRAAGGVYRKAQDFARLYGLTVKQFRELLPYIQISADYQDASTLVSDKPEHKVLRDTIKYPVKLTSMQYIALEDADTSMLKKVPGIGSAYAAAIFNYGKRLGGYVSVEQLREIGCIPEQAISYFRIAHPHPLKININRATFSQLRKHPYINYYQARWITEYRRLKGPLHSLQQLAGVKDFTEADITRLSPYICYQ